MAKKVAVLAVNPVNGLGLFTYLETFYENKIEFKLYAVSDTTAIHANSGVALKADDVVFSLKGHAALAAFVPRGYNIKYCVALQMMLRGESVSQMTSLKL